MLRHEGTQQLSWVSSAPSSVWVVKLPNDIFLRFTLNSVNVSVSVCRDVDVNARA